MKKFELKSFKHQKETLNVIKFIELNHERRDLSKLLGIKYYKNVNWKIFHDIVIKMFCEPLSYFS